MEQINGQKMIKRKVKKCKCCGKEGFIFGHGLIQECYRREYNKKQQAKNRGEIFNKKSVLKPDQKKKLDGMIKNAKKIKRISNTNTYRDSDGNRHTQQEINNKVTKAKSEFKEWFIEEHGYPYCEECKKEFEDTQKPPQEGCERIDISHTISEKLAKETGRVELCWDWKNNFRFLGRRHHQIHDKLN